MKLDHIKDYIFDRIEQLSQHKKVVTDECQQEIMQEKINELKKLASKFHVGLPD